MKEIIPINTDKEGNARTITAHYHKAGGNDFLYGIGGGGNSCHTAIMEVEYEE